MGSLYKTRLSSCRRQQAQRCASCPCSCKQRWTLRVINLRRPRSKVDVRRGNFCMSKVCDKVPEGTHTHTHTRLTALFPGLPGCAGTRKVKPIWILLKQETVSGSGISWAICKSAPRSRQITTPEAHHSVFYRPDALPATQPTASKH